MVDIRLNAGGVVDEVDFAWEFANGWVGFYGPSFALMIPDLALNDRMCVNGQRTTCDMRL